MKITSYGLFSISQFVGVIFVSSLFPFPTIADTSGEGRVVGVTVYRDRALVARSLDVELRPGLNRVEMIRLPADLDQDSLRVRAWGPAETAMEGFETRMETAEQVESPEYLAAEKELRNLLVQEKKLQDDLVTIKSQREFLDSIRLTIPKEIGNSLTAGEIRPESWQEAFGFLGRNLSDLADRERKTNWEIPDLSRKIAAARDRLQQILSKGQTRTLTAIATLQSSSTGRGEVRVEYLTGRPPGIRFTRPGTIPRGKRWSSWKRRWSNRKPARIGRGLS